jgi:3'(2'), 5'-bisphosphate nucleotidase/myo-inositol-1(or 4)-monophosphatase
MPLDLNRPDSTFMNHRGILYSTDSNLAQRIVDFYARP